MSSGKIGSKAGFQSWMQADPNVVWPLITAFSIGLIFFTRLYRGSSKDGGSSKFSRPTPQQTLNLIKTRRTISPKDYTGERITLTELETLLEAANWAPTHGKTEPWRYVVISGYGAVQNYLAFLDNWYTERVHRLSEETVAKFRKKLDSVIVQWPEKVSHLIVLGMKRRANPEKLMPEWEEICATAMAVQNLHLQAASMDIGVFWSSHTWCKDCRDSDEMKLNFGLEEEDRIFGVLTIGKYDTSKTFRSDRGPIDRKVHYRMD